MANRMLEESWSSVISTCPTATARHSTWGGGGEGGKGRGRGRGRWRGREREGGGERNIKNWCEKQRELISFVGHPAYEKL